MAGHAWCEQKLACPTSFAWLAQQALLGLPNKLCLACSPSYSCLHHFDDITLMTSPAYITCLHHHYIISLSFS